VSTRRRSALLLGLIAALAAGCGGGGERTTPAPAGAAVVSERRVGPRQLDLTIRSPALGREATVRLLEPDRGARPYPVLYLLHGCCDSYESWTRSTGVERMPGLRGALVVMPEGGQVGFYSDWLDGPRWETFHTRELPALLGRYGAGPRYAVAGLSMGGLGAIDYAARHPRRFRAAASFSGVLHPLSEPKVWLGLVSAYEPDPDALWGDPREDRSVWAAHDPTELAAKLRGTRLYVASGDGRPPGDGRRDGTELIVGRESRAFTARLRRLGIPFRADLYRGGRHDWPYWERDLKRALPVLLG
jgi:diacylglycerol O-acyltransferase/trehalose O-mycolyltransferase